MRVYWKLAAAGFRRQSHYRLAMFGGLFTNIIFGFVRSAVLLAAVRSAEAGSDSFAGYDEGSMGAYVWLSQGLLGAVAFWGGLEIAQRVKDGDIAIDFLRPIDIQFSYLATSFGRSMYTFLPRGVPSVLVGSLTFGLILPTTVAPYVLGLISVALAITVSYLGLFAVGLAGFWVVETRGLQSLYQVASTFLGGLYIPVHLFPGWLLAIAHATPFPSVLQTPIDVLSGRTVGPDAVRLVAVQGLWVVLLILAGQLLLRAGRRKLEVQGG